MTQWEHASLTGLQSVAHGVDADEAHDSGHEAEAGTFLRVSKVTYSGGGEGVQRSVLWEGEVSPTDSAEEQQRVSQMYRDTYAENIVQMGAHGWELVSVNDVDAGTERTSQLWFKRPTAR